MIFGRHKFVSSGCDDIVDLYSRVNIGTRVVVLPGTQPGSIQATANPQRIEPAPRPRPKAAPAEKGEAPSKGTTSAPATPIATATPPGDEMAE